MISASPRLLSTFAPSGTSMHWLGSAAAMKPGRNSKNCYATRNHLGLMSEDTAPQSGEAWGNFPQTYSMVGIVNGAMRLSRPWETVV